jgi:hypothetical protein
MGKKIAGLALVFVLLLSNSVFAASWVYYTRVGKIHTEYIDSSSVYKDGDRLTFWVLQVLDRPLSSNYAKQTLKFEVKLNAPREFRIAESCIYDANNRPGTPKIYEDEWEPAADYDNRQFDFALRYAKNRKDPGVRPTP